MGLLPALSVLRVGQQLGSLRFLATAATPTSCIPQTLIEKIVQKYTIGLPHDKVIKAGDYVMIRPEYVMTHDNTGPVISKCVLLILVHSALTLTPRQVQVHWR